MIENMISFTCIDFTKNECVSKKKAKQSTVFAKSTLYLPIHLVPFMTARKFKLEEKILRDVHGEVLKEATVLTVENNNVKTDFLLAERKKDVEKQLSRYK